MQQILQRVEENKERIKLVSENITVLDKKKKELEQKRKTIDAEYHQEMEKLRTLLSSDRSGLHLLFRGIRKRVGELIKEKQKIEYEIKKYRYHLTRAQNSLSRMQNIAQDSSDIYFFVR